MAPEEPQPPFSSSSSTTTTSTTTDSLFPTVADLRRDILEATREDVLGILIGMTKPDSVTFEAKRPVSVGEYVIITTARDGDVLGLVESSYITSDALSHGNVRNWQDAYESKEVAALNFRDKSFQGQIQIIGYLDTLKKEGKAILPAVPISPGSIVIEAPTEDLRAIFAPVGKGWLTTGSLLRKDRVPVKVDINKIYSRHLAVLAMTGMGKSNLIIVLAKEISKTNNTMLIFDYHGDYEELNLGPNTVKHIKPKIKPQLLSDDKFADIIDIRANAEVQREVISKAFTRKVRALQGEDFWQALLRNLEEIREGSSSKTNDKAAARVIGRIENARRKYAFLDAGFDVVNPLYLIKNGLINVVNLIDYNETQANVAMSYYLEELLYERKKAIRQQKDERYNNNNPPLEESNRSYTKSLFPKPILVVIEEAHVFIPRYENTDTKSLAARVAREGRKFGLGLVIVSQRPRSIDVNILSQMGSSAVMKLIQQDDQTQVAAASESLGKDLIEQLPSLNIGEAIFSGQWVNIPAFVKVEEVKDRQIGGDLKVVVDEEEE